MKTETITTEVSKKKSMFFFLQGGVFSLDKPFNGRP
ncbi:hypothetical protein D1BOALGB6SA_2769, partial [Olavius sp. associated proteobacterium Delta 1]